MTVNDEKYGSEGGSSVRAAALLEKLYDRTRVFVKRYIHSLKEYE
jgi:hypothetical protein